MILVLLLSCGASSAPDAASSKEAPQANYDAGEGMYEEEELDLFVGDVVSEPNPGTRAKKQEGRVSERPAPSPDSAPTTRAWFPETFLWQPLVVTDESGRAEVPLTVPDTLTTWRVLGLGATRDGAQAGDVHTFTSRLPIYVDPRLPPTLRSGDRIEAPVRVVNTTGEAVNGTLQVAASGLAGGAQGAVSIPANGSALQVVTFTAGTPGLASVDAGLDGADAIHKTVDVEPTGRKLRTSRSGLLGTGDAVDVVTPAGAEHARVTLTLYPGPLGVVRQELHAPSSDGAHGPLFRFALGAQGAEVLTALGTAPSQDEQKSLRRIRLEAQQQLINVEYGLSSPYERAILLDAVQHGDDPVAERMAGRLRSQLISEQLGDGSWSTPDGSTLQQLLVSTAYITSVLDDPGATVRAGAVFERHADHLLDPARGDAYTAAWVLLSAAGTDAFREELTRVVEDGVRRDARGVARVDVPAATVRPDGVRVSFVDAVAVVALALDDADLGAALVSAYRPGFGFGDGLSSLAALDALAAMGVQERPDSLDVVLLVDGQEVARHSMRGEALLETAVLEASAPLGGSHRYEVVSEGVWPGLAWHLDVDSWVSWEGYGGVEGLEVEVEHAGARLGEDVEVTLTVSAPRDEGVVLRHSPPAGFLVDRDSVVGAQLVRVDDSGVEMRISPNHAGLVTVQYIATPTFRGSLQTGPAVAALARDESMLSASAPEVWKVR